MGAVHPGARPAGYSAAPSEPAMPLAIALPLLALVVALVGCGQDKPTATWQVQVVSDDPADFQGCVEGETYAAINDSFLYEMYLDETRLFDLRIDGQTFATGSYVDGCTLEYESPGFISGYDDADVQWQLVGAATAQGAAGGCAMSEDGLDWEGTEIITITRSDAAALPPGCTRTLTVTGTFVP